MLRLHDYALSVECYTARLMLSLLGLAYETRPVDVYPGREQGGAAFRALSPDGALPVLEDGDRVVVGVGPVLTHLAEARDASGRWLPETGRTDVLDWLGFATGDLAAVAKARETTVFGAPGDAGALREAGWLALRRLDDRMTDRALAGGDWIAGDAASIADIACFPLVALSHDSGLGLEDFPALNLWQRRVRRLPGFAGMPGIPDYF